MKYVKKGFDDIVYRIEIKSDDGEFAIQDFKKFEIQVYTRKENDYYTVADSEIDKENNLIHIPASKISHLKDGIIRLKILTGIEDKGMIDDGRYDETNTTETCYYLKS